MSARGSGEFTSTSWDESVFSKIDEQRNLTKATVANSFTGDLNGESTLEFLMVYHADGTNDFYGLERVTGQLSDREGSFVLEHKGCWDGQAVRCDWSIVPGSGAGELTGIRGDGGYVWDGQGKEASYNLDYRFDD